jgi:hypothetical protein
MSSHVETENGGPERRIVISRGWEGYKKVDKGRLHLISAHCMNVWKYHIESH